MSDAPASPVYEPPAKTGSTPSDYRSEIVVAAGSATTLLALAGVFALARSGTNIMGWYANYIIPAGALLVGAVAASGYGIAAWITGLKMTPRLMWSVVAQLAISYFIAQYEQYRTFFPDGGPGFWMWFDVGARSFAWQQHDGTLGEPLGVLGYGLRALEVAGFVCGGVLVPIGLRAKPYCDPCRSYKRTKLISVMPAGAKKEVFKKVSPDEDRAVRQTAIDSVTAIFDAAGEGNRETLEFTIATRGALGESRAARKHTAHVTVNLVRCPRCSEGSLLAAIVVGQGNNIKITPIGTRLLPKEIVPALFD